VAGVENKGETEEEEKVMRGKKREGKGKKGC